jgi:hypothetical protein
MSGKKKPRRTAVKRKRSAEGTKTPRARRTPPVAKPRRRSAARPAEPLPRVRRGARVAFVGGLDVVLWTAICRTCVPNLEIGRRNDREDIDDRIDAHLAEPRKGQHRIDLFPEA